MLNYVYLTAKPGECPRLEPGMGGVCWEQCSTDADCSEDLKCCSNGCGHVCMAPGRPINQSVNDENKNGGDNSRLLPNIVVVVV